MYDDSRICDFVYMTLHVVQGRARPANALSGPPRPARVREAARRGKVVDLYQQGACACVRLCTRCVCLCAFVYKARVPVCVCVSARVYVCACVRERTRERERESACDVFVCV